VHRREDKDACSNLDAFRLLLFDFPMGAKEYQNIERNERKGNDGPTTALHLFMTQRNEHGKALSSKESREAAASSMEGENYRCNWSYGQVSRID